MAYTLNKPYAEQERIDFIVEYNHNKSLKIEETDNALIALEHNEIIQNGIPIVDPEYDNKQKQKEKERILNLSMTRSDFFDGIIKAFGLDSEELLICIEPLLMSMSIQDVEKKVAINNYKNALNFYRKHPLFTMLSNINIPITDTISINVISEQWDRFFDETNKKNPDAYKELIAITVEPEV